MAKDTKDIKLEATNLFLFVGPADSGKSFAATSWGFRKDDDRFVYMLELEGRLSALRGRPVLYDDYTNVEGAAGVLNRVIELRENAIKMNRTPFHTLILDSFTAFNDFSIADSLDVTAQRQKAGEKVGRMRGELRLLTVEDYGYEAEALRQLLWENLLDLKRYCNVIVTAHEVESYKVIKGAPGEPSRAEPDGYKILAHGNKVAARLPTKFDEIYHFLPKEVVVAAKRPRWQVCFQDKLARSSYDALKATTVPYDITGKEFYEFWKEKISQ